MAVPTWVQKHQVVAAREGHKRVPVRFYPSGDAYILPIAKFTVYEVHSDSILVTLGGLHGIFQISERDLEGGWEVVESGGGAVTVEEWVKPGARLRDRTGNIFMVSAVMGTEVVLRGLEGAENQYLAPTVTRMSVSQVIASMTPTIANVPTWACVGARIRERARAEKTEYIIRSINAVTSSILLEDCTTSKVSTVPIRDFECTWTPAVTTKTKSQKAEPVPKWLREAVFIRGKNTQKSYWVTDVVRDENMCRVQNVEWINYSPGQSRTPTIATTWDTISFNELDDYEVLDEHGYPEEHRVCSRCDMRGELSNVVSPDRSYRCSNGHSWTYTCDDKGNMRPIRNRFDLIDA